MKREKERGFVGITEQGGAAVAQVAVEAFGQDSADRVAIELGVGQVEVADVELSAALAGMAKFSKELDQRLIAEANGMTAGSLQDAFQLSAVQHERFTRDAATKRPAFKHAGVEQIVLGCPTEKLAKHSQGLVNGVGRVEFAAGRIGPMEPLLAVV